MLVTFSLANASDKIPFIIIINTFVFTSFGVNHPCGYKRHFESGNRWEKAFCLLWVWNGGEGAISLL